MKDLPIEWRGDLDDDCTAVWHGYMLRAEDMGQGWWWDVLGPRDEITSCYEHGGFTTDGESARAAAEQAVRSARAGYAMKFTCPRCGWEEPHS